jgi:hypothetical protein
VLGLENKKEKNKKLKEKVKLDKSFLVCTQDTIEGVSCNTPGVYHQLSSGFKLKHDRLVEMTMPKSNLWT